MLHVGFSQNIIGDQRTLKPVNHWFLAGKKEKLRLENGKAS